MEFLIKSKTNALTTKYMLNISQEFSFFTTVNKVLILDFYLGIEVNFPTTFREPLWVPKRHDQ
jgi:hypothetical protein